MDWFDEEMNALEEQLDKGLISFEEYYEARRELIQDLREAEYRKAMIDAGRGHLLR